MWTNKIRLFARRAGWCSWAMMVLSLQLRCQEKSVREDFEIKGLRFQSLIPMALQEGKVISYEKLLYIYESGMDVAIQYPVSFQRSKITVNKDGDIISDELEELSFSYRYVIYRRADSLGLFYDSSTDDKPKRISVDSFLVSNGVFNTSNLFRRIKDSVSLLSAEWNTSRTVLTERYTPAAGTKLRISDTIVLVHSAKMDKHLFSLPGSELRSKGMKIVRLHLIMNPAPDSADEIRHYRHEMIFELTESHAYLEDIRMLLKDFRQRGSEDR